MVPLIDFGEVMRYSGANSGAGAKVALFYVNMD